MTVHFLLAFLSGIVLRSVATFGVTHYIRTSKSDEVMKSRIGFHVFIITYMIGSLFKYGGLALLIASLIKQYLLT